MSRVFALRPVRSESEGARGVPRLLLRGVSRAWRIPTVQMFRSDPLLAFVTLLMMVCTWAPMAATPFLPLQDLPDHVGMTSIWWDALMGRGLPGYHYIANLRPLPYWTGFILMVLTRPLLGALGMAKFVVGFITVLMPVSVMRLMVALRRDPRLGLWAFLLCWDYNIGWGWLTHCLGVSLLFFSLANILEARDVRGAFRVWPLTILIGLTHVLPTGALFMMAGLAALLNERRWHRIWIHGVALLGSMLGLAPWLLSQLGQDRVVPGMRSAWAFEWHSVPYKLANFLEHTLGLIPGETALLAAAIGFMLLLFGPLFMVGVVQRSQAREFRALPVVMAIAALLLYFALPINVHGPIWHTFTYPRFASLALLFLLFIPAPNLQRARAFSLLPGLMACVGYDAAVYEQFKAFGEESRPFLEIIQAVEPNRSVMPLTFDDHSAATKLGSYNQFHAYIVAVKKGYDPFLFDYPTSPLIYRPETRLPQTWWDRPYDFTMESVGKYYDYVLIQGSGRDPLKSEPRAHLVKEAGRWRLYSINKGTS